MIKKIARGFFQVNTPATRALDKVPALPICRTDLFTSFLQGPSLLQGPAFYDAIASDAKAFEIYRKMVPYFAAGRQSSQLLLLVVDASYHPEAKTFELVILEPSGLYRKFVEAANFIPVTWDDACAKIIFHLPPFIEVDQEMVFAHQYSPEFYLFPLTAHWDEKGASHPDLDFRQLFHETRWLDDQHRLL
jgi:hypothetical protein